MSHLEIALLAIALSIDACIVSFSYGLVFSRERVKNSMLLASYTGLFRHAGCRILSNRDY